MSKVIEVFRSSKSGEFYFHIKARNGKIVAASQGYTRRDAAIKGLRSLKNNLAKVSEDEMREIEEAKC